MSSEAREQRVQAILHAYLEALDRGDKPDQQAFLDAHADLRDDLAEFFADASKLDQFARSLKTVTLASDSITAAPSLPTIRYFGDYELLHEIARGGMGVVYKAKQLSLGRLVALKMILRGELATKAEVLRFRQEAEAAANLDHPNIVPIYEVGDHEGQQYFSMKLIEGGSLAHGRDQWVLEEGMSWAASRRRQKDIAQLMAQVARAVHHAHQRGILHRDLKPANVLLDAEGQPHVSDFGLAKKVERDSALTQTGVIVGTPSYMAPEQANGNQSATTQTDVYGLGAMLYELLTGKPPFKANNAVDTLIQVRQQEVVRPCARNRQVDRDLETICLKCLERDLSRRYGSAEALQEDLNRWLVGKPIQARPVSAVERTWIWAKRRPAVAGLVAVSAVAAVALVGIVVGLLYHARLQEALDNTERARADEADARDRAEMFQYFHHVGQADLEWRQNSVGRMRALLDESPVRWRNWEWRYLKRLSQAELMTVKDHRDVVWAVAYSPDGTRFASAGADKTVMVSDAATGKALINFTGHTDKVNGVAFSPDSKWLASVGGDRTVRIINAVTGDATAALAGHQDRIYSVAFSPDGKHLATAGADQTVRLWDLSKGREVYAMAGHSDTVVSVAFTPDGKHLASAGVDKTVRLWDVKTGLAARANGVFNSPFGHSGPINSLAFSPNGSQMISATDDQPMLLWNVATGRIDRVIGPVTGTQGFYSSSLGAIPLGNPSTPVRAVVYSPDGAFVASARLDGIIELWNAATGVSLATLRGHTGSVNSVAFSPDNNRLVSASADGTVKVWDVTAALKPGLKGHSDSILSLSFSPDGKRLASAGRDRTIKIWDVATGREALSWNAHKESVWSVTFNADGSRLASASDDGTVRIWQAATGEALHTLRHSPRVLGAAFAPDGTRLASVGGDGTVRIWDVASGQETLSFKGHDHEIFGVAYCPKGGSLATASGDKTARIWDAVTGELRLTFSGHHRPVHCLVYGPGGQQIASGNPVSWGITDPRGRRPQRPGTIIIWDARSGREIHALHGHTGPVNSVAWHPDRTRLASASDDQTVRIWDVATGESLLTLRGHVGPVNSVVFSPDGTQLASAGEDRIVRIWDSRFEPR
jgi:WD40 repeat protein